MKLSRPLSTHAPRRGLAALLAVVLAASGVSAPAAVTGAATDWSQVSLFAQGFATTNPLILFGFNPQPEPPAATALWRSSETTASRSIDGVSGDQVFTILIGLEKGGILDLTAVPGPEETPIGLLLPAVQRAREAARSVVEIDFFTSSGGTPLNIVSFNPQPEPPPRLRGFDVWGLEFQFSSLSTARVTFSVDDGDGNRVTLTPVTPAAIPLPPAFLLGMGGLAALGAVRMRRRG